MNSVALANLFVRKEWEEWKREMERSRRSRLIERLSRWARAEGTSDEEDMEVSEDEEEHGAVEEEMEMKGAEKGGNEVKRVREREKEEGEEDVVEVDERVDVEEQKEECEVHERDEVAPDMNCEEEEGGEDEEEVGIEVETEVIREVDTEEEKEVDEVKEKGVMEAEETEEAAEEGENEFDSDVTENEGVVEEEARPVRGKEQEEEGDEEGEEHPEEAEHLRGQRRRSEDVTFEQSIESTTRDDRSVMEEEDWADSVESDTEDSGSSGFEEDFYNFQVINHEEEAVEKRYEHPEELEENSILAVLASKERQEEKDESEMLSDEPAEESWTIEDEKGETTDDEEAEHSADEDADDNNDDVTKIYRKDDYFQLVFGTLKEFQDASLLTDLTLSTDHGKSIHVHSVVLAAVSSLIREGLSRSDVKSNGADERKDRGDHRWSVSLGPEVDQVGLEAVVEFAYTGLMSRLNKDTVHQIMAAAQTLGALRVLDLCREDEETSTKTGEQEKEERVSAAEQMAISLQSIKQLWMEKMGCDVILEALGGSLHVHRAILAAGSDYFRSMFTLGMKESYQSCVILPFLLASDLEVLICCTYSGALPLSWGCVFEITSTALQLQYQPALSLCLNFLHQEINPHCCLDVVSFAEAHEMVQLLEAADDFVLRQFQKVACTSKFKDLPAKQLLKYLNSHSLCVPSELVVFKAVVAWIEARPRIRMRLAKELMKTIQFPLMTFKEFKEVKSLNMWSNYTLTELYKRIFEDFCSDDTAPQSQYRTYLPKESLILIGGDQTSEDLSKRNISRELWFGNSFRNHMGIRKAMEWRRLGEMPEPERFSHEVAVLKGQLYIFGGRKYYGINDTLSSVYRYDLLQNTWETLADMHEKRCSFSAVVMDGKIYAIGGQCGLDYKESVEQYCPNSNSWGFTWPLDLPLSAHVAKVLQGQIFVSGGLSSSNQCLASMFRYHPETGSTYLANMAKPRAHHCMETLGECLYVAGGITMHDNMTVSDQLACEVYDPVADSWTAFTSLPVPHVGAGSAVLEGKFYVLGGYSQEDYSDTNMVHRYDPTTRSWENMGKMPGPNNDIRASVLCLPSHFRL